MTTTAGRLQLTSAEKFWYILQCINFGAGYLAKVPVKKALSEIGLAEMTSAEKSWYVVLCIAFGAGYFRKVPVKKALTELTPVPGGYTGLISGQDGIPQQLGEAYRESALADQPYSVPPVQHGAPPTSNS
jgi:hypothetical protein